eukprot:SAG25_NODE_3296_length_1141_cov_1.204415_2_plen_39_part_01
MQGKTLLEAKQQFRVLLKQVLESGQRIIVFFGPHQDGYE